MDSLNDEKVNSAVAKYSNKMSEYIIIHNFQINTSTGFLKFAFHVSAFGSQTLATY